MYSEHNLSAQLTVGTRSTNFVLQSREYASHVALEAMNAVHSGASATDAFLDRTTEGAHICACISGIHACG